MVAQGEMDWCIKLFLITVCIFRCNGVSWRRQLEHIANARIHSKGFKNNNLPPGSQFRRFYKYDPRELSNILGVPSQASHLPEAEPILPGHTFLKPTLGMLKSAVKFPHKELEDGAGVYGNIDNLGIRYDARNERTLYSGFRRSPSDYIMVIPTKNRFGKSRFQLKSAVLDLERKGEAKNVLKRLNIPFKGVNFFVATLGEYGTSNMDNKKHISYYLNEDRKPSSLLDSIKKILRNKKEEDDKSEHSASSKELPATNEQAMQYNSEELEKIKKMEWLLQSKNSYDHIKVNQDAPEINDLMPAEGDENIRKWWFYNAEDYKPFQT